MYSFRSLSVLWLITPNIFTSIEQQVSWLFEINNLFNKIKKTKNHVLFVKVSKQIWILYTKRGFGWTFI